MLLMNRILDSSVSDVGLVTPPLTSTSTSSASGDCWSLGLLAFWAGYYNYDARISDFGLAKLLMIGQSQTHTGIRGTKGYVAPEWFRNLPITAKVDVYSFGVLLLEVICCRKSVDYDISRADEAILADWAYDCYREGTLAALVNDEEALNDMKKLERFVMVGIWCIQEDPSLRPTMRRVTQMLEGVVEVKMPPCPSPLSTFCIQEDPSSVASVTNSSS